jgi:Flp pilus assembly protein TadG
VQWKHIWKSEDGSTLVLTAIGMVAIIAFAGLAIDVGSLRYTRRHLQAAADAAAVAAALEATTCSSGTTNCAAVQTAATTAMAENGFSGTTLLTNCSGPAGTSLTIMVNGPPCYQGAVDPNSGNSSYVEVVASEAQPTNFGALVGYSSAFISVRAEAKTTPNPNCIWALDPTGGNAITVDLLATVNAGCGIVDESTAWNAISCNLIASVQATQVLVAGGAEGLLCLPSTTPQTNAPMPTPANPLSTLPKPNVPACGTSTSSPYHGSSSALVLTALSGAVTLYPDYSYCGGITIGPTANVTFEPGTFVIQSNGLLGAQGGMTISLAASVTGTGVTFYNYGPKGGITMVAPALLSALLGGVNLSAPTTGNYRCILFYQDAQNVDGAILLASANWNTDLEGAYYFPGANVLYGASFAGQYNFLIAKDIEFLASYGTTAFTSGFYNNYMAVPEGCPLSGGGSVLVQ